MGHNKPENNTTTIHLVMAMFSNSQRHDVTKLINDYANHPVLVSYANQWRNRLVSLTTAATEAGTPSTTTTGISRTGSTCPHSLSCTPGAAASPSSPTVFGLDFADQSKFLAACTSDGYVCIWCMPERPRHPSGASGGGDGAFADDNDSDEEFSSWSHRSKRRAVDSAAATTAAASLLVGKKIPALRLKISDGALYSCRWVDRSRGTTDVGSNWLVVSGDEGVLILDWQADILPLIEQQQQQPATTVQRAGKPKAHLKAFPSALEQRVEVNDFVIHDNHLFAAAGDSFGCYKFDIETEKVITNYREKGNTGYLHTVELLPNTNHLLFGGEDGILSLFDVAVDRPVDCFDMKNMARAAHGTQSRHSGNNASNAGSGCWISSCKARDEHWWTVAGGKFQGGGFVATFHAPTRSIISTASTVEAPQQLAFYANDHHNDNNSTCNSNSGKTLLSVANERYLSQWNNPLSLCDERTIQPERQRVFCSQPSAYAVSVSSGTNKTTIAVGGVGSVVDIFDPKTHDGIQLSLF